MLRLNPQSRKKPSPAAGSPLYAPAVTVPPRAKSQICVPVTEGFSSENDDRPTLPFKQLYAPQRSIHNSAWVDTQSEWNRTEPLVCTNTQRGWYSACLCRGGGLFWLVASKCLLYLFICIQHNQCKRFFGRVEYKSKLVMIDDYPLSLPHFPFTCSYALFQFVHMETWVGTKKKKKKKLKYQTLLCLTEAWCDYKHQHHISIMFSTLFSFIQGLTGTVFNWNFKSDWTGKLAISN